MTDTTEDTTPAQAPDLRAPLFAAQAWYADLVEKTDDTHLRAPTTCTEFDVRDLLTHMTTVFDKIVGLAADRRDPYADEDRVDEALARLRDRTAAERIDGVASADRAAWLRGRLEEARAAWTDDVLDAEITLGWGPTAPGRVVAAIYLVEVLAHGWDLAAGTGQSGEAPPEVAEAGLLATRTGLPEEPRGEENEVPFAAVVEPAPDAGPTERIANWTGRTTR